MPHAMRNSGSNRCRLVFNATACMQYKPTLKSGAMAILPASTLPLSEAFVQQHFLSLRYRLQSPRSFSGQCQTLPCEPPPLSQCAFQGLNKAQQMIAIQALGLPAVPAYNVTDGGLARINPVSLTPRPCSILQLSQRLVVKKETVSGRFAS